MHWKFIQPCFNKSRQIYICNIQIQPGLKAKLWIIFIVCSNKIIIKSCNAKRQRQCRRTVKNNNRSNQQKGNFAPAAHFFCTFLCHCFARLQRKTSSNFLVTRFFHSLFFDCCSFSPCIGGRQHFSFFHRRYKIFMLFFQQKNVSFVFYLSL